MKRFVLAALFSLAVIGGHAWVVLHSQPAAGIESYRHLTVRGQELFDNLADRNGQLDDAHTYHALEESQRTTFEAIIHALESLGIDDYVKTVDRIWGEAQRPEWQGQGRHQFRLSVTLTDGSTDRLRDHPDFEFESIGHVKRSNGDLVGGLSTTRNKLLTLGISELLAVGRALRQTDCVRQRGSSASLQISWLENEPTIGDIDIDYRATSDLIAHGRPDNSDIRASATGGYPHYVLHMTTYLPRRGILLKNWWNGL